MGIIVNSAKFQQTYKEDCHSKYTNKTSPTKSSLNPTLQLLIVLCVDPQTIKLAEISPI